MTAVYALGIDMGDTFTELVVHHKGGRRWGAKAVATHAGPQQGMVAGICVFAFVDAHGSRPVPR